MQDHQYQFPYHHLPHRSADGGYSVGRALHWGLEYLIYQDFVAGIVRSLQPTSVLEVGCGDGHLIGSLAGTVPVRVGADLSERALAFARAFHPDVRFFCGAIEGLAEQFDAVVAVEVLEHVPDGAVVGFLRSMRACIKEGGCLVLSVPTTAVPLHEKHYRHYTRELVAAQLREAGFNVECLQYHFVFRESRLLRAFRRLTLNRLWTLEIAGLNRLIWRHAVANCMRADEKSARHLVVHVQV